MRATLDFDKSPKEFGLKILTVAETLFASLKNVPLSSRRNFPSILKNNNFGFSIRVTRTHVFLEISSKTRASPSRDGERVLSYKNCFTSIDSGKKAVFDVRKARLSSMSGLTTEGGFVMALGDDISISLWDCVCRNIVEEKEITTKFDLLYIVGYGNQIHPDTAWQEFDALIRMTLSSWHTGY